MIRGECYVWCGYSLKVMDFVDDLTLPTSNVKQGRPDSQPLTGRPCIRLQTASLCHIILYPQIRKESG